MPIKRLYYQVKSFGQGFVYFIKDLKYAISNYQKTKFSPKFKLNKKTLTYDQYELPNNIQIKGLYYLENDIKIPLLHFEKIRQFRLDVNDYWPILTASMLPFIGYLPMFLAMAYPNKYLPHYFWEKEKREKYFNDHYTKKEEHIDYIYDLLCQQNNDLKYLINDQNYNKIWNLFLNNNLNLNKLKKEHILELSSFHNITKLPSSIYSSDYLINYLLQRDSEIFHNDIHFNFIIKYLINEYNNHNISDHIITDRTETLSNDEGSDHTEIVLEKSLLWRGLSPISSNPIHIQNWINSRIKYSPYHSLYEIPSNPSLLLHLPIIIHKVK